eukprot:6950193-Lingulodinium_polyedra.AAC.1
MRRLVLAEAQPAREFAHFRFKVIRVVARTPRCSGRRPGSHRARRHCTHPAPLWIPSVSFAVTENIRLRCSGRGRTRTGPGAVR